jgi:tRNA-Thr(GGU) m(6)t(6)A37 methyltransferase TsaA
MEKIILSPIGIIHTPFKDPKGIPIQPKSGKGVKATVEVFPEYIEGLVDLDGFSHLILLFHFHLSKGYSLKVKPFVDDVQRGVFATRAPRRPNGIGLSVVKNIKIEKNIIYIENIDIVDGTPLLDIKPYIPEFNAVEKIRVGWLSNKLSFAETKLSDERFL